jgi:hypothetical protein
MFRCLKPCTMSSRRQVVRDGFSFLEKASAAKQKAGGKVTGCALNLGELSLGSTHTSRS